jgi:hypothetical protein
MRIAVYLIPVCSIVGIAYEIAVGFSSVWMSEPTAGTLTELDAVDRVGTFRFSEESGVEAVYVRFGDVVGSGTEGDRLLVEEGAERSSFLLGSGELIVVGDMEFLVETVRPWVGILPDAGGRALISISIAVEDGEWVENMILAGNGVILVGGYRFRLELLNGRTVDAFMESREDRESQGRWGVREGDWIHWFDSLLPGSGVELDDGTNYTLLEFREAYETPEGVVPAIAVRVEAEGVSGRRIVTTDTEDDSIRFEYGSGNEVWFVVSRDRVINVIVLESGERGEYRTVEIGETWRLEEASMSVRIEQYSSAGVAIDLDQTPFREAVLVSEGKRVRVRQGEAVRVGDALLRYQRKTALGAGEYEVALNDSMDEGIRLRERGEVILEIDGVRYRMRHADVEMDRGVTLYPISELRFGRLVGFIALGIAALVMRRYHSAALSSKGANS